MLIFDNIARWRHQLKYLVRVVLLIFRCFIFHPIFCFGPLFHFSPNRSFPDCCFIFHPIVHFQTVVSFFTQNLEAARFELPTSRSNSWWIRPQDHGVLLSLIYFTFKINYYFFDSGYWKWFWIQQEWKKLHFKRVDICNHGQCHVRKTSLGNTKYSGDLNNVRFTHTQK